MIMEKDPGAFGNVKTGGLEDPTLRAWNIPNGSPGMRRHNGGLVAIAADGHVEGLRMPTYQPGAAPPPNFVELGDCSEGNNAAVHGLWFNNGPRAKLFCRRIPGPAGSNL
jgi:hypothetical protein